MRLPVEIEQDTAMEGRENKELQDRVRENGREGERGIVMKREKQREEQSG